MTCGAAPKYKCRATSSSGCVVDLRGIPESFDICAPSDCIDADERERNIPNPSAESKSTEYSRKSRDIARARRGGKTCLTFSGESDCADRASISSSLILLLRSRALSNFLELIGVRGPKLLLIVLRETIAARAAASAAPRGTLLHDSTNEEAKDGLAPK